MKFNFKINKTALILASDKGYTEMVRELLVQKITDTSIKDILMQ